MFETSFFKAGISAIAINIALSIVSVIVALFFFGLFGSGINIQEVRSGKQTIQDINVSWGTFLLYLVVTIAATFTAAGFIMPPLCSWIQE
jgi:hypothetical protein